MPIKNWSTTAASNSSAAPNGAPEGMSPAGVNDTIRQNMADVRSWYESPLWIDFGDTPTRTADTTFTIAGDVTARYTTGKRIRCTDSSTLYGDIVSSSYSAPNTTVTVALDSGALSASLTAVALSPLTADHIIDDLIVQRMIADNAVGQDQIADDAVGSDQVADDAIDTQHIADDAVESAQIADDAVTAAHLNDDVVSGQTAVTAPALDDLLFIGDASASNAPRKMTFENWLKVIDALTEDSSPTLADDFVVTYDASASGPKKVKLSNISVDQTAWTSYTPTVTAQSGTITTSSAVGYYKQIGKTVFYTVTVSITAAGTGADTLRASLPPSLPVANYGFSGSSYNQTTGKSGGAVILASGTVINARDAAGTTYIANGAVVVMTGFYETT